uniref:Secreted protein n=1 Tax=Ascaris lumbricoides TaxID=6252 RepID=A0A0M3HP78_ASCLU
MSEVLGWFMCVWRQLGKGGLHSRPRPSSSCNFRAALYWCSGPSLSHVDDDDSSNGILMSGRQTLDQTVISSRLAVNRDSVLVVPCSQRRKSYSGRVFRMHKRS